uniref:Uncharacterized protein LOC113793756 n=1 Tax=Dermatophagoides pteronyssinus TaxID=6956 RepID=A0A6P6Y599_DERPT|nr:uncharacterized protein LOC113793756 [Dermatophagoides pteronyssinus]
MILFNNVICLELSDEYRNLKFFENSNRTCSLGTLNNYISKIVSMAIFNEQLWIYFDDHVVGIYDKFIEKHYDHINYRLYLFDEKFINLTSYLTDDKKLKQLWPYKDDDSDTMGEVSLTILSSNDDRYELILLYWLSVIEEYERLNDGKKFIIINTYHRFLAKGNLNLNNDPDNYKFQIEYKNRNLSINAKSMYEEVNTQIINLSIDGKLFIILLTLNPVNMVTIFNDYEMKNTFGILCTNDKKSRQIYMIPYMVDLLNDCQPPTNQLANYVFGFNIGESLYFISLFNKLVLRVEKRLFISFQRKFTLEQPRSLEDFIACIKPTIWPPPNEKDIYGNYTTPSINKKIKVFNETDDKQSNYSGFYHINIGYRPKSSVNLSISSLIMLMLIKYISLILIYFNACHYCPDICLNL